MGHVPKLVIWAFLFLILPGKDSFFVHEMKLYQIVYRFLSICVEGLYDLHTSKHKLAYILTQKASSLGLLERTFLCLLLCDDVSLSWNLQFFPVFKFLFRHLGPKILQGKMEGFVILVTVQNVPFHEVLLLKKCRTWRLLTVVTLTSLMGEKIVD